MLKRVDVAVYNAFKDAMEGTWRPAQNLGLAEEGVGYALDEHNRAADHPGDGSQARGRKGEDHRRRARGDRLLLDPGPPRPARGAACPPAAQAARRAPSAASSPAVELIGIDKRFGPVHANKNVDLAIPRGTIHGIVGENGAGKSTLMNILYGYYQADRGTSGVNGQEAPDPQPEDAIRAGIGMVHQHFMLVEPFTVLENLLLGAEGGMTLADGARRARSEIADLEGNTAWRSISTPGRRPAGRGPAARRDPEGAVSRRAHPDPG